MSPARNERQSDLSVDPKGMHNKTLSMGSGPFLLIFSILVVVLDSSNFLAIGLAFSS
jgi:hypothetical protein